MTGSRVSVRGLHLEHDIDAWTALHNQPEVAADLLQIPFTSPAEWRSRIEGTQGSTLNRYLVAEINGVIAGGAGLHLYRGRRSHVGTMGLAVHLDYQRQGIGSALMEALIDLADNWYNLRRIEFQVYCDNSAALALYRKFGFDIEGTHHAYASRQGHFVDAYTMARLRNDIPLTRQDEE